MAVFLIEYEKVKSIEGLYSNDKDDTGGETIFGISRVANPGWPGWKIVDAAKKMKHFPQNLNYNAGFLEMVRQFYKKKYWDTVAGDILPQVVAAELYDIAVNCGVGKASEYLQRSLNVLNKNALLYPDITVDGDIGAVTTNTALTCVKLRSAELLAKVINIFQAKHYVELMESKHSQEKYVGWFSRV